METQRIATLEANYKNLDEKFDTHVITDREFRKDITDKLDKILEQTTKHNGRMSSIEAWRKDEASPILDDYKENRAQARGAVKLWLVIGGGVLAAVSYMFVLYMENFKSDIKREITTEMVDKVIPEVTEAVYNKLEEEYYITIK